MNKDHDITHALLFLVLANVVKNQILAAFFAISSLIIAAPFAFKLLSGVFSK